MNTAIEVAGLTKTFGAVRALDRFDLTVRRGEVHGLLGPNGAGKTTTVRVLLGLLRADDGFASVLGRDPWADAAELHRHLAYVPGDVNVWPTLTGGEVIDILGALRGGLNRQRRAELLERFQLDPSKPCRAYSKGNRQKVALVAAFASDVDLYLLDEPSSGLDPLMESVFLQIVAEQKREGKSVLLSSHILSEVEALCDRVTIVRHGAAVESGSFSDLRHLTRTNVSVTTGRPIADLAEWPGVAEVSAKGSRSDFSVEPAALGRVLARLEDFDVQALTASPPTLEELFLRHYGDTAFDDTAPGDATPGPAPAALATVGSAS